MSLLIFFLLLFVSQHTKAESACWEHETDPDTDSTFESSLKYKSTVSGWHSLKPNTPYPWDIYSAYETFKLEQEKAHSFGNDKKAHCYIGCKITEVVNYETAVYMGWKKEDLDLKDCNMSSHFEPEDYDYTLYGAAFGRDCFDFCK